MWCYSCPFYHSGRIENYCDLTENSNFNVPEECSIINDRKQFKEDWPELGFVKGKSAVMRFSERKTKYD